MPYFDLIHFIRKYSVVVANIYDIYLSNIYDIYLFFESGFSGTCSNLVDGGHWVPWPQDSLGRI